MELEDQNAPELGDNRPLRARTPTGAWVVPPGGERTSTAPPAPAAPETPQVQPEPPARAISAPPERGPSGGPPDSWEPTPEKTGPPEDWSALEKTHEAVKGFDPAEARRVFKVSEALGADPAGVASDLSGAEKSLAYPTGTQLRDLERDFPRTASWLMAPRNMAASQDDIENLRAHEGIFSGLAQSFQTTRHLFEAGSLKEEKGFLLSRRLPGGGSGNVMDYLRPGYYYANALGAASTPEERVALINARLHELEQIKEPETWLKKNLKGAIEFLPQMGGAGAYGAATGTAAAGAAAAATAWAGPGAALPAAGAGGIGFKAGEALYFYRLMGGMALEELDNARDVNGNGLPESVKVPVAMAIGAAQAGLSFVPFAELLKTTGAGQAFLNYIGQNVAKKALENPLTYRSALQSVAKQYLESVAHGTGAMVGITAIGTTGREYAKAVSGQPFVPPTAEGIGGELKEGLSSGLGTMGFLALPGSIVTAGQATLAARRAELTRKAYDAMGSTAEASKLREALPTAYQDFVEHATKDGPVENLYSPIDRFDTYFQSKGIDPVAVAKELGISESYAEAKARGGDVKIPTATWATKIVGTEHFQGLADDVKFQADDYTPREIEEHRAEFKKLMDEQAKKAAGEKPGEARAEEELPGTKRVRELVSQELEAMGLSKAEIEADPAAHAQVITNLAKQMRVDPLELHTRFPFLIQWGEPGEGGGRTMEQRAPAEFPAISHESQLGDFKSQTGMFDPKFSVKEGGQTVYRVGSFLFRPEPDGKISRVTRGPNGRFMEAMPRRIPLSELPAWLAKNDRMGSVAKALGITATDRIEYFQDNNRFNLWTNGKVIDARRLFKGGAQDVKSGNFKLHFTNHKGEKVKMGFNTEEDAKDWMKRTEDQSPGFINDPVIKKAPQRKPKPPPGVAETFAARFSPKVPEQKAAIDAVKEAQDPKKGPYVSDPRVSGIGWAPNMEAEPTGTIGPARISQPHELGTWNEGKGRPLTSGRRPMRETDPLKWADSKYGATKRLILRHGEKGVPLTINTSSDLIARTDYLDALPEGTKVRMFLLTPDDQLNRVLFPGNPSRLRQEEAVKALKERGIDVETVEPSVDQVIKAVGSRKRFTKLTGVKNSDIETYLERIIANPENTEEMGSLVNLPDRPRTTGKPIEGGGTVLSLTGERAKTTLTDYEITRISKEVDEITTANELADPNKDQDVIDNNLARLDDLEKMLEGDKRLIEMERAKWAAESERSQEPQTEPTVSKEPPTYDAKTIEEVRRLLATKPEVGYGWDEALKDAKSDDPIRWAKAGAFLDLMHSEGKHGGDLSQSALMMVQNKLADYMPKIRRARFSTGDGNLWVVRAEKDGHETMGVGTDKLDAQKMALSGGLKYDSMPASEAMMGNGWWASKAMLVMGSNNYLRTNAPFFLSHKWDLHVTFRPQSGEQWGLGLVMVPRDGGESRFVGIQAKDINQGFKALIGAALIEDGDHHSMMESEPTPNESKAPSESEKKREVWTLQAIYRKPKISLKDILSLEPYPKGPKDFFQKPPESDGPKAKITFEPTAEGFRAIVNLFKTADKSSLLHETGHYWLELVSHLANSADAPDSIKALNSDIRKWLGAKDGEALTTEQHEKWARAYEAYLREGNAPTPALASAFRRFSEWLTSIYRNVKEQLGIELDPEIRDIFDRLMASQEEVDAARERIGYTGEPMEGVAPEVQARIAALQAEARRQAQSELIREQMKELRDKSAPQIEAERKRLTQEAKDEVSTLPLYVAMNELGTTNKVVEMANAFLDNRVTEKVEAQFEAQAELNGFASGEELAKAILADDARDGFNTEVKQRVDAGMAKFEPLRDPNQLRLLAMKAIHDTRMTELLALEHEVLRGLVDEAGTQNEVNRRNRMDAAVLARETKDQAKKILAGKPIKEASNPGVYLTAERRAAVDGQKALAKGDKEAALEAKRRQMMNHALAAEAMRNAKESTALEKKFDAIRRTNLLETMPYAFSRQVNELMARYGLSDRRAEATDTLTEIAKKMDAEGKDPGAIANATGLVKDGADWRGETLSEFVDRVNDDYTGISLPPVALASIEKPYRALTMSELRDLHDAVSDIIHVGKQFDRFFEAFNGADIKASAQEAANRVRETFGNRYGDRRGAGSAHSTALKEKASDALKGMDRAIPELVNMYTLCRALDGGSAEGGPMMEGVFRPISEALNRKMARFEKAVEAMSHVFTEAGFTPKELSAYRGKRYMVEEIGRYMTKEELLFLGMNWGNEGNRDRVREGYGLNDTQVEQILDRYLEKRDWKLIQGTIDYLHTYWPDVVRLEMDVKGIEPRAVEPSTIKTKWGDEAGGYFPIAYDPKKSEGAYTNDQQRNALYKQNPATRAMTDRGHAESRVSSVKNRPLNLSFNVLFNHLDNVIHDLEFRRAVIDVSRFLRQPELRSALIDAIGLDGVRSFDEWLKAVASDQGEALSPWERRAKWFRFNTTIATIGARLVIVPLKLGADSISAMRELTPIGFAKASADYLMNRDNSKEFILARSERMKHRATLVDRDLRDMSNRWTSGMGPIRQFIGQYAFWAEYFADGAVSFPMWKAVYDRNVALHGDKKAREIADEAVDFRLGSANSLMRVGAQRGSEWKKLTSMFYTFHSSLFNQAWLDGKIAGMEYRKENYGKAAMVIAKAVTYGWLLPAIHENLWREWLRNSPDNQDDDAIESFKKAALGAISFGALSDDEHTRQRIMHRTLALPFGTIWLLRDIAAYTISQAQGHGRDLHMSPTEDALQTVLKPLGHSFQRLTDDGKEFDQAFMEEAAKGASTLLSTPHTLDAMVFNYLDYLDGQGELTWRDLVGRRTKK